MKIQGRTLVVEDGEVVHRRFETAAWWREIVLQGGEYPITDIIHPGCYGLVRAAVPGRVVRQYFPSQFGGVTYGSKGIEQVDEPTLYHWQGYAYMCKESNDD